ncbi:hypothetical protein [Kosakonia pseudosacchari]|uniref:hypothetical protein n=1 Tax=Kosakonia pseudosacchari TaxID=1646340 RepID=UPI000A37B1BB|nr:hypothetical protein [Kosakonia pseudosacchari]
MRANVFLFYMVTFLFYPVAQADSVQRTFKVDDVSGYIKYEDEVNYPLAFYYEVDGKAFKIEAYEVDGDEPHVETIF